ncbi:cytochrome C oxidase subunit IV family protein [Paenactinomyces guangxiensis]|uniref:Cytochrome C oxidase subunit IV family protein n=1 Tax=Paenactinomyces guangxiensis TaxID=1490290 RepID=A0A7W2A8C8_9BACL|nr:cytochrome C oxidase subunit IV family protein [Paenactinomyces guangxiensis]MBA4494029.1 cytochrome C oxidase subunit IV family protein [Paenactinomyces guangxiensis]MBH8591226.1 cytochrome C oxidase subunit IV family protein [Paenactinomyces guangxiensis]
MEPRLNNQPVKPVQKPASPWKYVLSFFWMIVFTAIAFVLVWGEYLNPEATFWVITFLASLQVLLQLFTFMHLDQKGQSMPIIFMGLGILIAVISAVGIVLM